MASQAALLLREIKDSIQASTEITLRSPESTISIPQIASLLRQKHGLIMQDFETIQEHIDANLKIVEKTELVTNILSYKMYETVHKFRTQMDDLKEQHDEIKKTPITKANEAQLALSLVEIDKNIAGIEDARQKQIEALKMQKIETQLDYEHAVAELDNGLELMRRCLNNLLLLLEAQKSNASQSEINILTTKYTVHIDTIKRYIDEYTDLQTQGWRELYPEEKISEVLDRKGLKVTRSGNFFTSSGKRLSFKQARKYKLLDDIDVPWEEIFAPDELSQDSPTPTSSNSELSDDRNLSGKISSEDVMYLKEQLGKPLTLALAEVTAVRPRDPIHYLGHWLFKYRYNMQVKEIEDVEIAALTEEREKIAKEKWHQFVEAEARQAVLDMIINAEQIAAMNDFKKWQQEQEIVQEESENEQQNNL